MAKIRFDEHHIELLNDLVGSQGWLLLEFKILPAIVARCDDEMRRAVRADDIAGAARVLGMRDGATELVEEIRRIIKDSTPKEPATNGRPNSAT